LFPRVLFTECNQKTQNQQSLNNFLQPTMQGIQNSSRKSQPFLVFSVFFQLFHPCLEKQDRDAFIGKALGQAYSRIRFLQMKPFLILILA